MAELDPEERAAIRSFLQRAEVRLSTVHRVATALLSGAGLMVLLPAIARDSIVSVIRALVVGERDVAHVCLLLAMIALLVLPSAALWLVVQDLTLFYFYAQHTTRDHHDVFTPRFTLTGLRLPADELGSDGRRALDEARLDADTVELLVPPTDVARSRIDRQLDAYGGLDRRGLEGDHGRARGLFELTASRDRLLLEEVAKVEHGMTRHILRLQAIVLRYAKALLAFVASAIVVFSAAAVLGDGGEIGPSEEIWLVCLTAVWAPSLVFVVTSPVRWLDRLLRAEGAHSAAAAKDPELTRVERLSAWAAGLSWCLVTVALIAVTSEPAADPIGMVVGIAVVGLSGVLLLWQLVRGYRAARLDAVPVPTG